MPPKRRTPLRKSAGGSPRRAAATPPAGQSSLLELQTPVKRARQAEKPVEDEQTPSTGGFIADDLEDLIGDDAIDLALPGERRATAGPSEAPYDGDVNRKYAELATSNTEPALRWVTDEEAKRHQLTDRERKIETILRDFDMDIRYGPCCGVTRRQRYFRAVALGLNPPEYIGGILANKTHHRFHESIFDSRLGT